MVRMVQVAVFLLMVQVAALLLINKKGCEELRRFKQLTQIGITVIKFGVDK